MAGNGFFVGVDVGTNSTRAGLFSHEGKLIRHCSREIRVWSEFGCLEQSSEDIWSAVCNCVKVSVWYSIPYRAFQISVV